jgi:2,4-dienoyl-CoA reductase-like NADH-dependent reductase (Old Yellow Enzyme family)
MTEGLADPSLRATERHQRLYRRWAGSGAGLLLTGNVMIDAEVLERPGNVAIDARFPATTSAEALAALRRWAASAAERGTPLWMQISHAGRQSPRYVTNRTLGPSPVGLELLGNYAPPRALESDEIEALVQRFAATAAIARDCGFAGVQIHAAHGYLLSAFLSPLTNRRTDRWGGSLENRARFLVETLRAVRSTVGPAFPIGLKLNSDDFRKGGFEHAECVELVRRLGEESIDLLELSGGTYEQPRLLGFEGKADSAMAVRASTRLREAYFAAYVESVRAVARMPLMLTGGFRSAAAMNEALAAGVCDVIGIARPFITEPEIGQRLLRDDDAAAEAIERRLVVRQRGLFGPTSPLLLLRVVNVLGAMGWYYHQIFRLADGLEPDFSRGVLRSFLGHFVSEFASAWRMQRARRNARRA